MTLGERVVAVQLQFLSQETKSKALETHMVKGLEQREAYQTPVCSEEENYIHTHTIHEDIASLVVMISTKNSMVAGSRK